MWDTIKKFIAERLDESSTRRGITLILGVIGWQIAPEHIDLIAQVTVAVFAYFHLTPDRKKTPAELEAQAEAERVAELAALKKRTAELEGKV